MRFAVGTKNPSKLFSVRGAVEKLFPAAGAAPGALASCRVTVLVPASGDAAAVTKVIHEPAEGVEPVHEIIGVEVASEVNAQPLSAWEVRHSRALPFIRALRCNSSVHVQNEYNCDIIV